MQARYEIVCVYYGLFDETRPICTTEEIMDAAFMVAALNKSLGDRLYSFDFRKLVNDCDAVLDLVTGDSICSPGFVCDANCMEDFLKQKRQYEEDHPWKSLS